jgi:ribosomal protein S12 methylthiotransferase accessory factor
MLSERLGRIGLEFESKSYMASGCPHLCWAKLNELNFKFHSQGKGLNPEAAMASAYAEMVERFSNRMLVSGIRYDWCYADGEDCDEMVLARRFQAYEFLPGAACAHENAVSDTVSIRKLLERESTLNDRDIEAIRNSDICRHWADGVSLVDGRVKKVPVLLVRRISYGNGVASGHTVLEATVQAAQEVFERRGLVAAITSKEPFPTLNTESIQNPVVQDIVAFYRKHNIECVFKNLSVGRSNPCIGLLLINHNIDKDTNPVAYTFAYTVLRASGGYTAEHAALRCVTEAFQGFRLQEFITQSKYDDYWKVWLRERPGDYWKESNLFGQFMHSYCSLDYSHLREGESVSIQSVEWPDSSSLSRHLEDLVQRCKDENRDFITLDLTHPVLRFPVVQVIIPGVSDILPFLPPILKTHEALTHEYGGIDEPMLRGLVDDNTWYESSEGIHKAINAIKDQINFKEPLFKFETATRGFVNRRIDLIALLAFLYKAVDDMEGLSHTLEALRVIEPKKAKVYDRLYASVCARDMQAVEEACKALKGCERFLVSFPLRHPLVAYCDSPCENACEQKLAQMMYDLRKSFFKDIL